MSSRFKEIGSEFWIESVPEVLHAERDGVYCLSGRTAIDLILQHILQKRLVKTVAMPAWCCDSMISPFLAHGIEVKFYDVAYKDGQLVCYPDFSDNTDIFYLTNYFGYENTIHAEKIKKKKEQGSLILYDRTHSFLMKDEKYQRLADYSFASIRKWLGVVGGAVVEGLHDLPEMKECRYAHMKEVAMRDKFRYLLGDRHTHKEDFLAAFGAFSHHLAMDYCNYEMDNLSYALFKQTDLRAMKQQRRKNAEYIHKHLKEVQFLCEFTENAAPLFVPVLFKTKEQRDALRIKLIENKIYCPIHWPQPNWIPAAYLANDIVDRELSLLCDQRYGLGDIEREINTIMDLL